MSRGRLGARSGALVSLAVTVAVLLVAGSAAVAVRTSSGPTTLASVGGSGALRPPPATPGPLSNLKPLDATLATYGYPLPPGADVYAARVTKTAAGLSYDGYQAGGGALDTAFWPASSIKVLAAVGALEFVGKMGFTGAATVTFAGWSTGWTIQSIYDSAIRESSNEDYDTLVQIAGVEWLNHEFLTPARGFPVTVIQRSYAGGDASVSPAMTLVEGSRRATIPARTGADDPDCPQANCSDLFEMSESIRRVVLNDEIPEAERFHIARSDVSGITGSLMAAEGWIGPSAARVFGPGVVVYSKPGYVAGRDCLDVTLIAAKGQRYLLAATVPDSQGGCDALQTLSVGVLRALLRGP